MTPSGPEPATALRVTIFDEITHDTPQSFRRVRELIARDLRAHGAEPRRVSFDWPVPFDRRSVVHSLVAAVYRHLLYPLTARRQLSPSAVNLLIGSGLVHLFWLAKAGCPLAVFCHDVFPFLSPGTLGHELDFGGGFRRRFLQAYQRRAFLKAELVLVPSQTTRRDVIELVGVEPGRVFVVPNRVDREIFRPGDKSEARRRLRLPADQFLVFAVATTERRKNLARLFEAFRALRDQGVDGRLVLLGGLSREDGQALRRLGLVEHATLLRDLDVGSVALCYQAADCCAFVSLYEGFGFPALEAMASGCPLVCSDRGAIPEVAGTAARYVDALRPETIAAGLAEVFADAKLRRTLTDAGLERARAFEGGPTYYPLLESFWHGRR
jgi:glycosyltransferase involved in cell wall biosynthesis